MPAARAGTAWPDGRSSPSTTSARRTVGRSWPTGPGAGWAGRAPRSRALPRSRWSRRGNPWGCSTSTGGTTGPGPSRSSPQPPPAPTSSQLILIADRERWQVAWERAEHRSTHDVLTGLPARGLLFDRLDHALATMTGRDGAVAVLFIDVARTRPDEDTGGQRTGHRGPDDLALDGLGLGDWALGEIAHRLSQTLRVDDTLARLSGGEFVIVCEALTGTMAGVQDWLHEFGERILLELRRPEPGRTVLDVSVSIGAAVTTSVCSALHLTSQAEMARYAAKHSGGNRLVIHRNARRP